MKKFLYMAVAAIAALSSCSDNDIVSEESGKGDNNGPVFTATIEGDEESGNASAKATTRTTLAEGSSTGKKMVNWSNGDKININGKEYSTTSTTNTATFTAVDGGAEAVDGKYIAVYPTKVTVTDYATNTINLPYWQYYDTKTNGIKSVPMVAVSTSTNLEFKNVCAVLAIKVASGTVKRIMVKADQKTLSGDFRLNTSTYGLTPKAGGYNSVGLYCQTAVTANNTTFYIAIPAQEYSSLQIYIAADDENYKEAMATKVPAGLGTLVRNKIYNINYQANAVQLWKNGPYFATENVGTSDTGTSKTYSWGATADGGTKNTGDYDLNHDTAYKLWGSAWRMPTKDEAEALKTNCTLSYSTDDKCWTFTSKTSGYGSVSFISESTVNVEDYWTSTVYDTDAAWMFRLYGPDYNVSTYRFFCPPRASGSHVRAVLRTPSAAPDPNLLRGKFSVSASKKVQFTKGNLYWDGSNYKFEEHQYDYPTNTDYWENGIYNKTWLNKHVGHFYWTSWKDYNSGNANYMPYAKTFGYSEMIAADEFFCSENHKLTVENTTNLYVLSKDEWNYLLNHRIISGSQRYKLGVTVAGKTNCVIIAPDDYTGTIATEYTAEAWVNAEVAGLVCLPAAGQKITVCIDQGVLGSCWTSTHLSGNVYPLIFSTTNFYFADGYRQFMYSIRLVK